MSLASIRTASRRPKDAGPVDVWQLGEADTGYREPLNTWVWAKAMIYVGWMALILRNPVSGGSIDAAPRAPIVSLVPAMFFWLGLGVSLLFIKQARYQLLLSGWLIGMLPILVAPGSEGRGPSIFRTTKRLIWPT